MTIFNLGLKNIKHNFKNYISYFISILTSVFILTVFYSIYYNNSIQSFSLKRAKVIIIFKMASFMVILFSAIFIWYSNSFFIKNKKKEIAIYSLVGMKKKEIGMLMFCENIFLGIAALIIGIPAGAMASTFFLKVLTICMKASKPIKYNFDIRIVMMTFIVFIVIFAINSEKAYGTIYKFTLIELLHAKNYGESVPKYSKKYALLSIIMISCGYFIALTMNLTIGGSILMIKAVIILFLVVCGTYMLFDNFIIYVLTKLQKNKKIYYKGENLIGISQIVYRIKGNSKLLATIAVISSTAITALCFTFSFNMMIDKIIPNGAPFSVMYESGDDILNKKVENLINDGENNITYMMDITAINGRGLTQNYEGPFEAHTNNPFDMFIISESQYKDILKNSYLNKDTDLSSRVVDIKIPHENDCFFIEVSHLAEGRGRLSGEKLNVDVNGEKYSINISDSDIKGILGIRFQKTTIVIHDKLFKQLLKSNKDNLTVIRAYNFNNPLKDDEKDITDLIEDVLKKEGFKNIIKVYTGFDGIEVCREQEPDIVILDIMLPDIDGIQVCKSIREFSYCPILFLSAKNSDVDKIIGLSTGGDDYITKPFSPREIAFRIKAQLRRQHYDGNVTKVEESTINIGDIIINKTSSQVYKNNEEVNLTAKEYKMLLYMAENAGRIINKERLCEVIWGEDCLGYDNTISVHIRHLREKLEENPSKPQVLLTIIGLGYKLVKN